MPDSNDIQAMVAALKEPDPNGINPIGINPMLDRGGRGAPVNIPKTTRLRPVNNPLTGRLQVAPVQKLSDLFVEGNGGVQTTPNTPLRGNTGKFSTVNDYYRYRVPTEEERTALQQNPMYDPANPPPPVISHMETAPPADPVAVQQNLSKLPNSFLIDLLKNGGS